MSVDVFVFLKRSNLPSTDEWQETLTKLNTGLLLDAECQAEDHSGYWPASFPDGLSAGFEFLLSPVAEGFGPVDFDIGDRDFVANFITHSDMRELKGSMFAAASLAVAADGLVFDEETGDVMPPLELLQQARNITL